MNRWQLLAARLQSQHAREAYRLYEDVPELLRLSKGRFALGLVTNGASDTQSERLRWFDMERHFSVVAISGEVGVAKPDAAIFRFALDRLGVSANSAWHVGDNLHSDVAGAKAAELTAVWLNRNGIQRKAGDPEPDLEIASLTELLEILAAEE